MRIVSVEATAWTLPLRAPFVISQRTAHEAQNVLVTVCADNGVLIGRGGACPAGYVTGESVETVLAAVQAAAPMLEGSSIERLGPLLTEVQAVLPDAPAARAGLEMALYDLWARAWQIPLWQHFGGARDVLVTDLTIPIVSPTEAGTLAMQAWTEGFRHLKIKVGDAQGHEADLARVEAVLRAVPDVKLRIDANQAFDPEQAIAFTQNVLSMGAAVELLEQPTPKEDIAGLKYVKDHVSIPVFADESAQSISEVLRLLREDAVDGINVKLMKSGLSGALQIVALCRAAGKQLMLGCMLESGMGIAAAAQMAGGLGVFDFLDLDSHRLLSPIAGLSGGFDCDENRLRVGQSAQPGWGVQVPEPDAEK